LLKIDADLVAFGKPIGKWNAVSQLLEGDEIKTVMIF